MQPLDSFFNNSIKDPGAGTSPDLGFNVSTPAPAEPSLWDKIVSGWNDFWSRFGNNLQNYYSSSGGYANLPISEIMEDVASPIGEGSVEAGPAIEGDSTSTSDIDSAFTDALDGSVSVSDYFRNNPGASAEDILKFMASQSDEWTEKWMDYVLEKESINEQNAYTANREDTAYQRLVSDLKKAGLNPAMMYGSSAGTSASGSTGVVKASEGANSRQLGNYEKLKTLILAYMTYSLKMSSTLIGGSSKLLGALASF